MDEEPSTPPNQTRHSTLKIWQQNVNNSKTAHLDLLNMVDPNQYHVLAIQEPYTDSFGISRGNRKWEAVYPPTHDTDPKHTRSMLLISTRIPSDRVQPIKVNSKDISAVRLQTEEGPIAIYNIYNDCQHSDAIATLNDHLQQDNGDDYGTNADENMIWVGDFNRHHPMWDELRNDHLFTSANLDAAETLLELRLHSRQGVWRGVHAARVQPGGFLGPRLFHGESVWFSCAAVRTSAVSRGCD